MDVRKKVVTIIGAARGIGQEFSRSLAAAGTRIVAADINGCSVTLDLVKAQRQSAPSLMSEVPIPPGIWQPPQPEHSDASTR